MRFGINISWLWPKSKAGIWLSTVIIFLAIAGCGGSSGSPGDIPNASKSNLSGGGLPEDFVAFYKKFHSDSVFQINHIVWPLRGIPRVTNQTVEELEKFTWKKNNWDMHTLPDASNKDYIIEYDLSTPQVITENIRIRNTDLRMMRRFAESQKGTWFMIYYTALNDYSSGAELPANGGTGATE